MNKVNPKETATSYLLKALIPYTDPNMKLVFKPHTFFNDLEKLDKKNQHQKQFKPNTLRLAYYKAKKNKYFTMVDGTPVLTELGKSKIKHYKPRKLNNAKLLVIFDVPEKYRKSRDKFRTLLKSLYFEQVQKSVWVSKYDSRDILQSEIKLLRLEDEVRIFEAAEINI